MTLKVYIHKQFFAQCVIHKSQITCYMIIHIWFRETLNTWWFDFPSLETNFSYKRSRIPHTTSIYSQNQAFRRINSYNAFKSTHFMDDIYSSRRMWGFIMHASVPSNCSIFFANWQVWPASSDKREEPLEYSAYLTFYTKDYNLSFKELWP